MAWLFPKTKTMHDTAFRGIINLREERKRAKSPARLYGDEERQRPCAEEQAKKEEDMDPVKTGKLIRELRTEKGWTQQQLASELQVSPTAVSKWENAKAMPDISLLEPMALLFDLSVSELVAGERTPLKTAAGREEPQTETPPETEQEALRKKKRRGRRGAGAALFLAGAVLLVIIVKTANQAERPLREPSAHEAAGCTEETEKDLRETEGRAVDGTDCFINSAYPYPLRPGAEEWKRVPLETLYECSAVPSYLAENMTTEALLQTVLDYPFIVNLYAGDTPLQGINTMRARFAPLDLLLGREDALSEILKYREEYENGGKEAGEIKYFIAGHLEKYIRSDGITAFRK